MTNTISHEFAFPEENLVFKFSTTDVASYLSNKIVFPTSEQVRMVLDQIKAQGWGPKESSKIKLTPKGIKHD